MLKSALLAVLAGIQFTCFTGTNVQILTLRTRRFASLRCASELTRKMRVDRRRDPSDAAASILACPSEEAQVLSLLALLVQKYKY